MISTALMFASVASASQPAADDTPFVRSVIRADLGDKISKQREFVVKRLDAGLHGTPMHDTGRELEAAAHKWGISPYAIVGISGKESSLGAASCRNNPKNIWGLKSCGLGSYVDLNGDGRIEDLPWFRTWAGAYDFFSRYMRARHSYAHTVFDIRGYCVCDHHQWASRVAWFMRDMFRVDPLVGYVK